MMKKYPNDKPFKPSIKLKPLIKIIRQKVQNKILKYLFDRKLSKNKIVVDLIWISLKRKKSKITINCRKIFLSGFFKYLKSDNNPMQKNADKYKYQIAKK